MPWISKFNKLKKFWEKIESDTFKKEKVVRRAPDLAVKLYDRFKDKEIGRMFVERYQYHPEYHDDAYFISVRMNTPIERKIFTSLP